MSLSLPTSYIPLEYAAEKYNISEKSLFERIKSGRIASAKLPSGELLVAENDVDPSLNIRREDFEHLRGKPIGVAEAGRKYGVINTTLSKWTRTGYIKVLVEAKSRGQKKLIDEADVAYCAAVYKAKCEFYDGRMAGVTIFDENGDPYQAKHPEVAAYKRAVRQRQRERERKARSYK